jgi:antitoxin HigA-1
VAFSNVRTTSDGHLPSSGLSLYCSPHAGSRARASRRRLRERLLEPLGFTSGQVARAIGELPEAVRRISQEEMHLSAKMAVRLGRYFGTRAEYWGELQLRHDLAVAGRELAWDLRKIEPHARVTSPAALTGG